VAASRTNAEAWSCATYDARGRILTRTVPANGTEAARSVIYRYSGLLNNPLVTSVSDPAGTITTTTDLLGRVVSYSDVWGKTTTSTYDQAGRLTETSGPVGTQRFTYDDAGRLSSQSLDGSTLATPAYDGAGELASVAYANSTSLSAIARDPGRRTKGLTWTGAGGSVLAVDVVARSQSGRVYDEAVDGADAFAGNNFDYDPAGRLMSARVPGHAYTYTYATSGGCGPMPNAGLNTNRTSMNDNGATTMHCYDAADRLTSSSDASVGSPAYDARGNTTTLGTQSLTYDGTDRHTKTVAGSTTVTYVRDATDRIVSRSENGTTTKLGYSGPGDSSDYSLDSLGVSAAERTISLHGGVLLTKRSAGDVWSYPTSTAT
jgi:YD repeat-containing protein